jgi:hypothetical protein
MRILEGEFDEGDVVRVERGAAGDLVFEKAVAGAGAGVA